MCNIASDNKSIETFYKDRESAQQRETEGYNAKERIHGKTTLFLEIRLSGARQK